MAELGARDAIMTAPDGCYAHMFQRARRRAQLYRVRIAPREPRATIGSGDAFLAGFVAARYQGNGRPVPRHGVACGAESTEHLGAGLIDPGQGERFLAEVEVEHGSAGRSHITSLVAWLRVRTSATTPRIPPWKLRSAE